MSLESLYEQVGKTVSSLDFEKIWPGFKALKFALYDRESCFFDGRYVEKTDAFCANTSILYEGEQIAIWMVQEDLDISVLTSKLVHEMFHGFQRIRGWECWPDEMDALYSYRYDPENLSLKLRENEILLELKDHADEALLRELLASRRYRSEKFPYEYSYERKAEEIEGTANYVEWQVLRQLDPEKASALEEEMRAVMTKPESLFPIRISCYYTGALMISALLSAGLYDFDPAVRPAPLPLLKDTGSEDGFSGGERFLVAAADAAEAFCQKSEEIVQSALDRNEIVLQGPCELAFVNIYDARCFNGYLTSTYFVMYREGSEDRMLQGDFVIKMKDKKTIDKVYRWK